MGAAEHTRERWSSDRMFLLAVIGGAVGLGNIWRFPYVAGESGGGVFLIMYVACVLVLSLPLKMAEVAIGKRGRGSPVSSFANLAEEHGRSRAWRFTGWSMSIAMLMTLSFYSIIGGWCLKYVFVSFDGSFRGLVDAAGTEALFDSVIRDPLVLGFWHLLFLAITVAIVALGIHKGIERVFKVLVPALMLILAALVVYATLYADFGAAAAFLFGFDFSKASVEMLLVATGQAFFSLGVGTGVFLTYGSYMPSTVSVASSMLVVGVVDTVVAVTAGLAIFPFVFGFGLSPASGPGLFFLTLPIAFGSLPAASVVAFFFFFVIFLAAVTSSVGMLECGISRFKERRPEYTARLAVAGGGFSWLLGIFSVLSFNVWDGVAPLGFIPFFEGRSIFQSFDYLLASFVLPVNGILVALFVGWVLMPSSSDIGFSTESQYRPWRFLIRYVIPLALGLVMVFNLVRGE
jgi:NSS family neurotransmitter:Na+ symporter